MKILPLFIINLYERYINQLFYNYSKKNECNKFNKLNNSYDIKGIYYLICK